MRGGAKRDGEDEGVREGGNRGEERGGGGERVIEGEREEHRADVERTKRISGGGGEAEGGGNDELEGSPEGAMEGGGKRGKYMGKGVVYK